MTNEELAVCVQSGDRDSILVLWEQVRRFGRRQARRWENTAQRRGVTMEDLEQSAFLALMAAVDSYRPERGKFLTWYGLKLSAAFAQAAGMDTQTRRRDPLAWAVSLDTPLFEDEGDTLTVADVVADFRAEEAFLSVEGRECRRAVKRALNGLTEPQRAALWVKYVSNRSLDNEGRRQERRALRALRRPEVSRELAGFR